MLVVRAVVMWLCWVSIPNTAYRILAILKYRTDFTIGIVSKHMRLFTLRLHANAFLMNFVRAFYGNMVNQLDAVCDAINSKQQAVI